MDPEASPPPVGRANRSHAPRLGLALIAGAVGLLALAMSGPWARDTSLRRHQDGQPLRVGYAVEAPYAFVDGQGKVTGEGPTLARHVADALRIERIVWVQTDFASLVPDLLEGRFDVVAAGLFITAERKARVAFSTPTFLVGEGILHRVGAPIPVADCRHLAADPALRLAVLEGSVEGPRLRVCGVPSERIVPVPDPAAGRAAVQTGIVDGLVLSEPTVRWMALRDPAGELQTTPASLDPADPWARSPGGFAFRHHDRALAEAWDAVLRAHIGSGEHLAQVQPFGFQVTDLPPPALPGGS